MENTITYSLNGTAVEVRLRRPWVPPRWAAPAAACLLALLVLVVPAPALADAWDNFVNMITDPANSLAKLGLDMISSNLNDIADKTWFTAEFTTLLPDSTSTALYNLALNVSKGVIFTPACSMLALAFLLQLMRIAQRIDGNAALPAVKEIIMLYVIFALCVYVVGHSFSLTRDFYDLVNSWTAHLATGDESELAALALTPDLGSDVAAGMYVFFLSFFVFLVIMAANALSKVMFAARAVQIYLYAIFSPLMLSMLCFDELRHWAMGFIKGFLSCCLSGFVMLFAITAYPYAMTSLLAGGEFQGDVYAVTITSSTVAHSFTGIVCVSLALGILCLRSGSYARDILGG